MTILFVLSVHQLEGYDKEQLQSLQCRLAESSRAVSEAPTLGRNSLSELLSEMPTSWFSPFTATFWKCYPVGR